MKLKATKTPLLIAAIATAITVVSFAPAHAQGIWASAPADGETAQVIDANFKVKVRKHGHHHGYKRHYGHKRYYGHRLHHGHRSHHHKFHHGYRHHGGHKRVIIKKLY